MESSQMHMSNDPEPLVKGYLPVLLKPDTLKYVIDYSGGKRHVHPATTGAVARLTCEREGGSKNCQLSVNIC
jgi:hypothetical protein